MRIGILCHSSFGGSARVATRLAEELAERGHKVHLFARTTPFGEWNPASGVILHTMMRDREEDLHPASLYTDWPTEELEAFVACILDVIATEGLDVLHFHYAVPFAFVAAEVRQRLGQGAPVLVGTLHGTDVFIHGRDPVKGPQLAQALRHLDALTAVSVAHARLSAEVFGLPAQPEVIFDFVNLSRFHPQAPPPPGRGRVGEGGRSRPKIVHISNFRPVKNVRSVARIFVGIREQMEAELWLIGDGQEMEAVKSILQQGGCENNVRYWGLQRDVAPLLAQTDLLLVASSYESFCLVALEAMACGVPVLATRVGGLPEVVVHGETGFLYPMGDLDSAVNLAVSLLSDPARHQAMREAAARHARRFGSERIVPAYEDLYQRLL
jgi:N-acetyl-alpha-D-glucosaminyl L-malate synthase BshA